MTAAKNAYRRSGPPEESVDVSHLTDGQLFALYDETGRAYRGHLRNGQEQTVEGRRLHKWLVAASDEIAGRGRQTMLAWALHKERKNGGTHR